MSFSDTAKTWNKKGISLQLGKSRRTIFYRSIGQIYAKPSETLLILHGFPESSFSFSKVIKDLTLRFKRIVLFDFIGFGMSDKPVKGFDYSILAHADTAEMVWRALSVQGGHLLCHDMATSVGTELLARQLNKQLRCFQKFESYTFTNGSMVLDYAKLRLAQKLLLNDTIGPYFSKFVNKPIFAHQVRSAHGIDTLTTEDIDDMWSYMSHNGGRLKSHMTIKYYHDRVKYENNRWLPALSGSDTPIHLCWGDQDQVAPITMAYYLSEKICPQAKFSIVSDSGHFAHIGSPADWTEKILAYY